MRGVCKICGCTWTNPCFSHKYGFCWWPTKEEDICSHCHNQEIKDDPNVIHRVKGLEFPVLTVHQPYALMLVKGVKKIEYRNWKLPQQYVGQRIFIHAGRDLLMDWCEHYSDEEPFYQCRDEAMTKDAAQRTDGLLQRHWMTCLIHPSFVCLKYWRWECLVGLSSRISKSATMKPSCSLLMTNSTSKRSSKM